MTKILSVIVHIKYFPKKARRMLNQGKTLARDLRLDLTRLKLPHPPEANILPLVDEEEIAFFWETRKFSVRLVWLCQLTEMILIHAR